MLTENEVNRVWERMAEAEVRSLYFADLAANYTTQKQVITGISFFLSSGAAATLIAKLPTYVPIALALIVALTTAYSMALGLDRRIRALTELHYQWNQLSADYEHLWNHWHDADAEDTLEKLIQRARDASEAATEMPYREATIDKWQEVVYSRLRQATAQ